MFTMGQVGVIAGKKAPMRCLCQNTLYGDRTVLAYLIKLGADEMRCLPLLLAVKAVKQC